MTCSLHSHFAFSSCLDWNSASVRSMSSLPSLSRKHRMRLAFLFYFSLSWLWIKGRLWTRHIFFRLISKCGEEMFVFIFMKFELFRRLIACPLRLGSVEWGSGGSWRFLWTTAHNRGGGNDIDILKKDVKDSRVQCFPLHTLLYLFGVFGFKTR